MQDNNQMQNKSIKQQWDQMSIEQKIEVGANICYTVALPVLILLRSRLGYRFISMPRILIMSIFFLALGAFSAAAGSDNGWILVLFSLGVVIAGFWMRRLRWNEIKRGASWHTRSRGISRLNRFVNVSDSVMKRFIDPAAVLVVGILFALTIQHILGYYLVFTAICLLAWESYDYDKSVNLMLDQYDNLIDSEVMSENMEFYGQAAVGQAQQRPLEQTAGIPTGVAPDLQAAIERRRSRSLPSPNGAMPGTQYHPSRQTAPTRTAPTAVAVAVPAGQNGQGDIDDLALVPANQNHPTPPTANQNQSLDNLVLPDDANGTA